MQLRTSTEEEYPDDCRPLYFSSKFKFLWSSITGQLVLVVMVKFSLFANENILRNQLKQEFKERIRHFYRSFLKVMRKFLNHPFLKGTGGILSNRPSQTH